MTNKCINLEKASWSWVDFGFLKLNISCMNMEYEGDDINTFKYPNTCPKGSLFLSLSFYHIYWRSQIVTAYKRNQNLGDFLVSAKIN